MDGHDHLSTYAEWAGTLSFDDLPASVVEKTKLHVANTLAAGFASTTSEGVELTTALREHTSGPCTAIDGSTVDPVTAYFLNSMYSQMHDYDDYLFRTHTGHGSVWSSIAAGEMVDSSGADVLRSVAIGNELGGRLGMSGWLGPHNGQTWAFNHQANAAASTAALLGEDASDILHAVAIAMYIPPYPLTPGFMGGDSKTLTSAIPGASGFRSALFALSGARGFPDILTHSGGFYDKVMYLGFPEMLTGFGDAWVSDTICFKPNPGCAYLQATLNCLEDILDEHGSPVTADEIGDLVVTTGFRNISMEENCRNYWTDGPVRPVEVTFSNALSAAILLLNGEYTTGHLTRDYLTEHTDEIRRVADTMRFEYDEAFLHRMMDGINRGIDFAPLFESRDTEDVIYGLENNMRKVMGESGAERLPMLMTLYQKFFDSPLGWEEFDLANAVIEDFEVNYGSAVELRLTDGRTYHAEYHAHKGANGRDDAETRDLIYEKLSREAGRAIGQQRADELVAVVETLDQRHVTELSAALRGTAQ